MSLEFILDRFQDRFSVKCSATARVLAYVHVTTRRQPVSRKTDLVNSRVNAGLSPMKISKKAMPKLARIDARFAERTGVLESLRNRYPEVIEKLIKLLIAANKDSENHLHQFAFELDGFAYLYGRTLNSRFFYYGPPAGIEDHPDYVANQSTRRDKLEAAAQALTGLSSDLRQLDLHHLKTFISSYRTPTGRTKYNGPLELFSEIDLATRIIAACQAAYASTFRVRTKTKGRKPLPIVDAVRALINIWESYTGKKVPVSKTHQNAVTTNPANFIHLGISLIVPNASAANVVTAINNALSKSP